MTAPADATLAIATVDITEAGYLHLPAELAARYVPADVCVARRDGNELVVMPLAGAANGGMVLSQRNRAGDRSVLVSEVFDFAPVVGTFPVTWDTTIGALRVHLDEGGTSDGDRGAHGGRAGGRAVGGLPAGGDTGGGRPTSAGELLHRDQGPTGGRRDPAYGGPATGATEGTT